jgi:hypothetical protein
LLILPLTISVIVWMSDGVAASPYATATIISYLTWCIGFVLRTLLLDKIENAHTRDFCRMSATLFGSICCGFIYTAALSGVDMRAR